MADGRVAAGERARREPVPCDVAECDAVSVHTQQQDGRAFCASHYKRARRNGGDPLGGACRIKYPQPTEEELRAALVQTEGRRGEAADALGISRGMIKYWLQRFDLYEFADVCRREARPDLSWLDEATVVDAVTRGGTVVSAAADLGLSRNQLHSWIRARPLLRARLNEIGVRPGAPTKYELPSPDEMLEIFRQAGSLSAAEQICPGIRRYYHSLTSVERRRFAVVMPTMASAAVDWPDPERLLQWALGIGVKAVGERLGVGGDVVQRRMGPENYERYLRVRVDGRPSPEGIDYLSCLRRDPCGFCGTRERRIDVDHIEPRSRGGRHHWSNFAAACWRCNSRKRAKPLLTFMLEERCA